MGRTHDSHLELNESLNMSIQEIWNIEHQ